jgi:membrane-bound serine protease (ClpP class)
MKRIALSLLLLFGLASSAGAGILRVVIDDMIHPISEEVLDRALTQAAAQKDTLVLIELRTPGGLMDSMRGMVEKILKSPVPVVVYVTPSGGYAASAGFFLLEAADIAAMAPGTNTGAAHPVALGGEKLDPIMVTKIENDAAALMRTIATKRLRNVAVAESAVRQSKSFTEGEALTQHLIDIVSPNSAALLKALDGRSIQRFDGTHVVLKTAGQPMRTFEPTLRQRLLGWLMDPNVAFLLLSLGALALWAEFNHPGTVLPGVVGVLSILLALFALNLLPTRFAALALIALAFALFALEAKFVSHGVLGTGGIVSLVLGALLLVDGPIPEMRVRLITALGVSIPIGVIAIFLMTLVLRSRNQPVVTGEQGMIGEIGVARTSLEPDGKVFVHGELWNARAAGPLSAGTRVRVRGVDGLRLLVEPLET